MDWGEAGFLMLEYQKSSPGLTPVHCSVPARTFAVYRGQPYHAVDKGKGRVTIYGTPS